MCTPSEIKSSGSRCVWVGPPDAVRGPFASNLAQGVRDGIHYGAKDSAEWGKKITEQLSQHLPVLESKTKSPSKEPKTGESVKAIQ